MPQLDTDIVKKAVLRKTVVYRDAYGKTFTAKVLGAGAGANQLDLELPAFEGLYASTVGENQIDELEIVNATGGDFTLTVEAQTTAAIAFDADAATIQAALEALSTVDPGDVAVTGTGPFTVTWAGQYEQADVAFSITDTGLTGGGGEAGTITNTNAAVVEVLSPIRVLEDVDKATSPKQTDVWFARL